MEVSGKFSYANPVLTHQNIDFQIALEMQIIDHDDNLLGFVLRCEYLLPLGDILSLHHFSESIE